MTPEVIVPESEVNRQAIASLKGYLYQIYQSVGAWIDLAAEETLLLEVAEDFALATKDALKGVQVKDVGGSVTLKNEGVRKTLVAYWEFKQANPEKDVSSIFVTTASIGKENKGNFPDGAKGIEFWSHAAREGVETTPLRDYLSTLELSDELQEFISDSTDKEFRDSLLRKITWCCKSPDITILQQNIRDKITCYGEGIGFPPSDSERALDALLSALLVVLVKSDSLERRLSRAEFLKEFEKATSISLPVLAREAEPQPIANDLVRRANVTL